MLYDKLEEFRGKYAEYKDSIPKKMVIPRRVKIFVVFVKFVRVLMSF